MSECTVHVSTSVCAKLAQGQASEARLTGCFHALTVCVLVCVSSACATPHVYIDPGSGGAMYYSYKGWGEEGGGGVRGIECVLLSCTSGFTCEQVRQCRLSFPGGAAWGNRERARSVSWKLECILQEVLQCYSKRRRYGNGCIILIIWDDVVC